MQICSLLQTTDKESASLRVIPTFAWRIRPSAIFSVDAVVGASNTSSSWETYHRRKKTRFGTSSQRVASLRTRSCIAVAYVS